MCRVRPVVDCTIDSVISGPQKFKAAFDRTVKAKAFGLGFLQIPLDALISEMVDADIQMHKPMKILVTGETEWLSSASGQAAAAHACSSLRLGAVTRV